MENTFLNTQQDIVPAANAITISPAVEQYVQRYRPNSWTAVDELAKLETDKFATLGDTGSLTATATMKELREIINEGPKQSADTVTFTLTVKAKNPAQAVEIDRTLGAVGEQLQSAVRVSNKELFERFMAEALEDYDLPEGYLEPEDLEAA